MNASRERERFSPEMRDSLQDGIAEIIFFTETHHWQ